MFELPGIWQLHYPISKETGVKPFVVLLSDVNFGIQMFAKSTQDCALCALNGLGCALCISTAEQDQCRRHNGFVCVSHTFDLSCWTALSKVKEPVTKGTTCSSLRVNLSLTDSSPFQLSLCVLRSTKQSDGSPSPYHLYYKAQKCSTYLLSIAANDISMCHWMLAKKRVQECNIWSSFADDDIIHEAILSALSSHQIFFLDDAFSFIS